MPLGFTPLFLRTQPFCFSFTFFFTLRSHCRKATSLSESTKENGVPVIFTFRSKVLELRRGGEFVKNCKKVRIFLDYLDFLDFWVRENPAGLLSRRVVGWMSL